MDKIEELKAWLETFPQWGEADWEVDLTGMIPVSYRLTMEDDRVIRQTEDVLGNRWIAMQTQFALVRVSYGEETVSMWADDFTNWVLQQSKDGCMPEFGDTITQFHLEKGKLEMLGDKAVYTVKLISTYERLF